MPKGIKYGGRQKGTPNGTTSNAKAAIEDCFEQMGGVANLVKWAKENETDFYKIIYPKILPLQVTGNDGGPLVVSWEG